MQIAGFNSKAVVGLGKASKNYRLYCKEGIGDIMKVYYIRYQWKQIIEVVYEYLISECEKYFHVKNQDCLLFHVEPNEKDKTLIIALMYDECEQYFKDNIQDLAFTGFNFARIFNGSMCYELQKSFRYEYLTRNEIRYLKLHYNDIVSLLISITAQILKLRKYNALIKRNERDEFILYVAKKQFDLMVSTSTKLKFMDITEKVAGLLL